MLSYRLVIFLPSARRPATIEVWSVSRCFAVTSHDNHVARSPLTVVHARHYLMTSGKSKDVAPRCTGWNNPCWVPSTLKPQLPPWYKYCTVGSTSVAQNIHITTSWPLLYHCRPAYCPTTTPPPRSSEHRGWYPPLLFHHQTLHLSQPLVHGT